MGVFFFKTPSNQIIHNHCWLIGQDYFTSFQVIKIIVCFSDGINEKLPKFWVLFQKCNFLFLSFYAVS